MNYSVVKLTCSLWPLCKFSCWTWERMWKHHQEAHP